MEETSMQIPVGFLHAEKISEVALLNVFRIGFPASIFSEELTPSPLSVIVSCWLIPPNFSDLIPLFVSKFQHFSNHRSLFFGCWHNFWTIIFFFVDCSFYVITGSREKSSIWSCSLIGSTYIKYWWVQNMTERNHFNKKKSLIKKLKIALIIAEYLNNKRSSFRFERQSPFSCLQVHFVVVMLN